MPSLSRHVSFATPDSSASSGSGLTSESSRHVSFATAESSGPSWFGCGCSCNEAPDVEVIGMGPCIRRLEKSKKTICSDMPLREKTWELMSEASEMFAEATHCESGGYFDGGFHAMLSDGINSLLQQSEKQEKPKELPISCKNALLPSGLDRDHNWPAKARREHQLEVHSRPVDHMYCEVKQAPIYVYDNPHPMEEGEDDRLQVAKFPSRDRAPRIGCLGAIEDLEDMLLMATVKARQKIC